MNGKVTIRELCIKFDNIRERNDVEHSQILERLDRIEKKLDVFPCSEHSVKIENIAEETRGLRTMAYAGLVGLIGWLGTVVLWFANQAQAK